MNTNGSRQGGVSNSRTPDRFCASEKQLAYLTACQDVDYAISVTDACTVAGVGRQTYYDWLEHPGFNRWWLLRLERHFMDRLPAIYSTLFEIVQKGAGVGCGPGKVAAAKLLLERFDKLYRPKTIQEHTGSESIEEYLNRAARKQLEEEAQATMSGSKPPGDCSVCHPPEPSVEPGKARSDPAPSL